jgi:hypothetical protein
LPLELSKLDILVIFLTGSIPKCQLDLLSINLNIGDIVLEDSGDIDLVYQNQMTKGKEVNGPLGTFPWKRQ